MNTYVPLPITRKYHVNLFTGETDYYNVFGGGITGRNGYFNIVGVQMHAIPSGTVYIEGIGQRGSVIRGGIDIYNAIDADKLCLRYLVDRGLLHEAELSDELRKLMKDG